MIEYTVQVFDDGSKIWYLNGELHREDGPASEYPSGAKAWYLNGKRHREDGPAVECANGTKFWYLNGEHVTEEEHKRRTNPIKEMSKFHVIYFDRYDTEDTTDEYVEANSFKDVLEHIVNKWGKLDGDYDTYRMYLKENFRQVRDNFGCLPEEENDLLIYKMD